MISILNCLGSGQSDSGYASTAFRNSTHQRRNLALSGSPARADNRDAMNVVRHLFAGRVGSCPTYAALFMRSQHWHALCGSDIRNSGSYGSRFWPRGCTTSFAAVSTCAPQNPVRDTEANTVAKCTTCKGTGEVTINSAIVKRNPLETKPITYRATCLVCDGAGEVPEPDEYDHEKS